MAPTGWVELPPGSKEVILFAVANALERRTSEGGTIG